MNISIKNVFIVYMLELVIMVILSIIGFYIGPRLISQSTINVIKNELLSAVKLGPNGIFLHNLEIDTLMAVPMIGPVAFIISLTTTGFILGVDIAYTVSSPLVLISALLVTLFFPHGIIELLAYAFSTTGSITFTLKLFRALRNKGSISKNDLITLLTYYAISVVLLFIAANLEYLEIIYLSKFIKNLIS